MEDKKIIELKKLSEVLSKSEKVNNLDAPKEKGKDLISYSLSDIYDSSKEIIKLIDTLKKENLPSEKVDDILFDIGEEFRHIIYHINDSRFYDYLNMDLGKKE